MALIVYSHGLGQLYRIDGLCNGSDLVYLDEDAVGYALSMPFADLCIGDE